MHRITVLPAVLLAACLGPGAHAEHRYRERGPWLVALAHDLVELSDDLQDQAEKVGDRSHRGHRRGRGGRDIVVSLGALKNAARVLESELREHDARHPSVDRAMRSVESAWWRVEDDLDRRRAPRDRRLERLEQLVRQLSAEVEYVQRLSDARSGWTRRPGTRGLGAGVGRGHHDRAGHYHPGHDRICYERH